MSTAKIGSKNVLYNLSPEKNESPNSKPSLKLKSKVKVYYLFFFVSLNQPSMPGCNQDALGSFSVSWLSL